MTNQTTPESSQNPEPFPDATAEPPAETSLKLTRRGLQLRATQWGDPEAAPVILLHGFLDCGRSWTRVARILATKYRVIAPDMRGFGTSGWIGAGGYYHFYDYYDDVLSWLRRLEIDTFSVVGHSMGGSIAAGVAAIAGSKCQSVVLLEGLGPPANDPAHSIARLQVWTAAMARDECSLPVGRRKAARRRWSDLQGPAARLRKYNDRLDEAQSLEFAEYLTERDGDGYVFRHDPMHLTPAAKPFFIDEARAMWRAIKAPVLHLSGAESTMPTQDFQGRFAELGDAVSLLVKDAGHNIHHDQPEQVANAVLAWFSRDRSALSAELGRSFPGAGRPAVTE